MATGLKLRVPTGSVESTLQQDCPLKRDTRQFPCTEVPAVQPVTLECFKTCAEFQTLCAKGYYLLTRVFQC